MPRFPSGLTLTCLLTVVAVLCTGVASQACAADNELSRSERIAGWELLFDGEGTEGWRNYKKDSVSDGWQIQDGALVRAGNGAGDIMTEDRFGEFELSLEYKISEEGNSGIMFRVTEEGNAPWHSGPEIQIQDNVAGHDPQKSGWLYQLYQPPKDPETGEILDATRPAGEWNHVYLRLTDEGGEVNVNGVRYYRFKVGNKDWNERVAASKFSKYDFFGKAEEGHIVLQDHGDEVAYRNIKVRRLDDEKSPNPVNGTLPFKAAAAFPGVDWEDWEPINEQGKNIPLRPIVVTNAGDGSGRIFVATQRGVIHVLDGAGDDSSEVFIDISDRVTYNDRQNEEGFLGLAFHPKFEENGQFFVYYTSSEKPHTSIISRFRTNASSQGDPDSEEQLMAIEQPFWNHNGGTLEFGPDGYLYIGLGDGGSANDPHYNGQDLSTLLGSLLRIDVDTRSDGKAYGIPDDNPFVDRENAQPEIYAYGFRNIWRFSFDRDTGELWVGDVGQNLWEEIHLVEKGGNYGWNHREGMHPFGKNTQEPQDELIDPIWEYDHQVGKSITGGVVYRGKKFPELQGMYLYADYVTGRLWALEFDRESGEVKSNYALQTDGPLAIITFGEDEQGEVYFTTVAADGQGVWTLEKTE